MPTPSSVVRKYLAALEALAKADELLPFFTPDALQIEHPNRLNPNGQTSDLAALLARVERGRTLLRSQRYELRSMIAEGDRVAVEAEWTGTLTTGATLSAHLAMFFELREGRIATQRNYDCFEPF